MSERDKSLADRYWLDQGKRLADRRKTRKPSGAPFAERDAVAALFVAEGNVTRAAELMGVKSDHLRRFASASPAAKAEMDEALMKGVDLAVDVIFEGLRSDAWANRFAAAKEMLKSQAAARRGFHQTSASVELKAPSGSRLLMLRWLDPGEPAPEPKTIEGEIVDEPGE